MANEEEPKPTITITDSSKIYEDMSRFYLKETFSDIQLILPDKKIHAHKIVLAARCKHFESLLLQNPEQSEVILTDVPSKAFEIVLDYIYRGSIAMLCDGDLIFDVLKLAHAYSLQTLENIVNEKMVSLINISNVCALLNKANTHDMDELREVCHKFIEQHVPEFVKSDFLNNLTQKSMVRLLERDCLPAFEIDVFRIAANWSKSNTDVDHLVTGCIRLSQLTQDEILNVVWPSKIIDNDRLLNALASITKSSSTAPPRIIAQFKDKNIAIPKYNAKIISGLNTKMLLEGSYNYKDCAYRNKNDKNGITIDLGAKRWFNHIKMSQPIINGFGFFIEISNDQNEWFEVIDYSEYYCHSVQDLYFKQKVARYIRLVVMNSTRIGKFEVYLSSEIPDVHNQVVCHPFNVITSKTYISSGQNSPLDTNNFEVTLWLNQPYVISRMKVLLRFYRSINVIEIFVASKWEQVANEINENCTDWQILIFKERIVNAIAIKGKLALNKTTIDINEFLKDFECFYECNTE